MTTPQIIVTIFSPIGHLQPDINPRVKGRREIEFLSTIGILHGNDDGNFYPERAVTRQYLTKIMLR